jgi:hypothetical protein
MSLQGFACDQDNKVAAVEAVKAVMNQLHTAASKADGETYFNLFIDSAIYIGTDAGETWTIAEFKAFAEPYFSKGRGWTYVPTEQNVYLSPDEKTAWFDELLWNDSYGVSRGTGVLIKTEQCWKFAQYHLTFPIPNDLAKDITTKIKNYSKKK